METQQHITSKAKQQPNKYENKDHSVDGFIIPRMEEEEKESGGGDRRGVSGII